MGGGLIQLVAYGAQDVYLTGNPQITFFKVVYRRYTNFAMESIEQTFNGTVDFGKRVTCTISRNGDLVHRMYLQVTLPEVTPANTKTFAWCDHVGLALIKSVEIEIGGQKIDKHYGEWMYIWNELTQSAGKKDGYQRMIGHTATLTSLVTGDGSAKMPAQTLFVPLEFWFCRNPGLALPLIALQYHEVKVNMEFRDWSDVTKGDTARVPLGGASLWADYIFLDTDERRRFAQSSHEFLIEQLQFTGDESITGTSNAAASAKVKLSFNHPVKEFVWIVQRDDFVGGAAGIEKEWFNFSTQGASNLLGLNIGSNTAENPVAAAKLQLNGHDRFTERSGDYFSLVQPYQHHENVPTVKGINVYSFALKPEEHQPSGTLNCSRIDTAVLQLTLRTGFFGASATSARVKVYATSYNVLRLLSGMGGLAYSS